jgi:hypothetical protein
VVLETSGLDGSMQSLVVLVDLEAAAQEETLLEYKALLVE